MPMTARGVGASTSATAPAKHVGGPSPTMAATVARARRRPVRSRAAMRRYSRASSASSASASAASTATPCVEVREHVERAGVDLEEHRQRPARADTPRRPRRAAPGPPRCGRRMRDERRRCGRARAARPPDRPIARSRRRPRRRRVMPRVGSGGDRPSAPVSHLGTLTPWPASGSAMAQLNTVVGDLDGNVTRILDALDEAEAGGRRRRSCSPSSPSPATRPRTCAEARLRGRQPRGRSRQDRRPHRAVRRGRRLRRRGPRPPQRGGGLRARRGAAASTASACCRTTRCSTSSATSSPGDRAAAALRDRAASRSASRSARTPGARRARSPRRPPGGAELVVNLNASPYYAGRVAERERMLATRAADASCALVYVNQVGGQDELVFDGASLVFDADGSLVAACAAVRRGRCRRRPRRRAACSASA